MTRWRAARAQPAAPTACGGIALNVTFCAFNVTVKSLLPELPVIPAVAELRIAEIGIGSRGLRDRVRECVDSGLPSDWNRGPTLAPCTWNCSVPEKTAPAGPTVALRFTRVRLSPEHGGQSRSGQQLEVGGDGSRRVHAYGRRRAGGGHCSALSRTN